MMHSRITLSLSAILALAACSSGPVGGADVIVPTGVGKGSTASGGAAVAGAGTTEPAAAGTFSYVGQSVIDKLTDPTSGHATFRHRTWNTSTGNAFNTDWILQSPLARYWGQSPAELPVAAECTVGDDCDDVMGLYKCSTQADCTKGGLCQDMLSTVTKPGAAPARLCVGHSDALADEYYKTLTSAESFLDITSLSEPDGRMGGALRNALTYLSHKPNPPRVRMIFGGYPFAGTLDTWATLKLLTRGLDEGSKMPVAVGTYHTHAPLASLLHPSNWAADIDSLADTAWNHSKIVAVVVDGKTVIVGGENLWGTHYLDKDPVHDVAMRIDGPAALDAHRFVNMLWDHVCEPNQGSRLERMENDLLSTRGFSRSDGSDGCPTAAPVTDTTTGPAVGGSPLIAVGRTGPWGATTDYSVDDAILAMLGSARGTIKMSLQDLGPVKDYAVNGYSLSDFFGQLDGVASTFGFRVTKSELADRAMKWPTPVFDKLSEAMARGVDVYVVLSNLASTAGGLPATAAGYSNGWTTTDVAQHVYANALANADLFKGADVATTVCQRFHVGSLRITDGDDTWPDGTPFGNHGKFVSVDSRAFFLGSYNLYLPESLAEYGYVVDDANVAREMDASYWSKLWQHSQRTAITGSEVALTPCIGTLKGGI